MSAPTNPELDALQALTESEGWRILSEWYDKEWGPTAFAEKVARAIGGTLPEAEAVRLLQQTTVALKAVQGMKDWPTQQIAKLKAQRDSQLAGPNLSRRGPGL